MISKLRKKSEKYNVINTKGSYVFLLLLLLTAKGISQQSGVPDIHKKVTQIALGVHITWDMPNCPAMIELLDDGCPSDVQSTGWCTGGDLILQNTQSGSYRFRVKVKLPLGVTTNLAYTAFGFVQPSNSGNVYLSSTGSVDVPAVFDINCTSYMATRNYVSFNADANNSLFYAGETKGLVLNYMLDCTGDTDPDLFCEGNTLLTMHLINGAEYVSFIKNGVNYGDEVTVLRNSVSTVSIKLDKVNATNKDIAGSMSVSCSQTSKVYENMFTIKPGPISISVEPPVLSPRDTALVKIQIRNVDGTLVNFPAGQHFEAGITGGCDYGKLLSGTTQDIHFSDFTAPLKFVAADSLSVDSGAVSITAGALGYYGSKKKPSDTLPSYTKYKKVKDGESCFAGEFEAFYVAEASAVVEDPCGNYPKFEKNNYTVGFKPKFNPNGVTLKDIRDGSTTSYDACAQSYEDNTSGASMTLGYSCYESDGSFTPSWDFQLLTEKDLTDKQEYVHFQLVVPGTTRPADITINVVTGVCDAKIRQYNPNAVIMTNDEIGFATIPPGNKQMARQAVADFEGHYKYPSQVAIFYLYDAILQHEREHMNNFFGVFELYKAEIIKKISDYRMLCKTYSGNAQEQAEIARKAVFLLINESFRAAIDKYREDYPPIEKNAVKGLKIENDIQGSTSYKRIVGAALSKLRSMYSRELGRGVK